MDNTDSGGSVDGVKLTGLWKAKDRDGNVYLRGNLNGITSILVMSNIFKREPKDPDYYLYLKPHREKPENRGNDL